MHPERAQGPALDQLARRAAAFSAGRSGDLYQPLTPTPRFLVGRSSRCWVSTDAGVFGAVRTALATDDQREPSPAASRRLLSQDARASSEPGRTVAARPLRSSAGRLARRSQPRRWQRFRRGRSISRSLAYAHEAAGCAASQDRVSLRALSVRHPRRSNRTKPPRDEPDLREVDLGCRVRAQADRPPWY
jgi:hypothetical protein